MNILSVSDGLLIKILIFVTDTINFRHNATFPITIALLTVFSIQMGILCHGIIRTARPSPLMICKGMHTLTGRQQVNPLCNNTKKSKWVFFLKQIARQMFVPMVCLYVRAHYNKRDDGLPCCGPVFVRTYAHQNIRQMKLPTKTDRRLNDSFCHRTFNFFCNTGSSLLFAYVLETFFSNYSGPN